MAIPLKHLSDTLALAHTTAAALPPGQLLLLSGPLGAGKTTFVAALCAALGSDAAVTSPTYTLVHEYPCAHGPVVHIDLYRLPTLVDVDATLDLEDALARARVVVVEWGERLLARYPQAWHLTLERHGDHRSARWTPARGPA